MNVQYAIKDDVVYVLEVNPRASRTVPYLSKATGVPLAKVAARVMAGRTLAELGLTERPRGRRRVREEPGVPVRALPGRRHDPRARDEVHRRGDGRRRQLRRRRSRRRSSAVGQRLPETGTAFVSVNNDDKAERAADRARPGGARLPLVATRGTAAYLRAHGLEVDVVYKVNEGRPNIADEIVNRKIDLVVNTPLGRESFFDDRAVRRAAMMHEVPCITTLTGAAAAVQRDPRAARSRALGVRALQDYYAGIATEKV